MSVFVERKCLSLEGTSSRTPALNKRGQNDNSDTASGYSGHRLTTKRNVINDTLDASDNMYDKLLHMTSMFCYYKKLSFSSRSEDNSHTRQDNYGSTLAFDVNEFFSFGSPLSLILAYRKILSETGRN